MLTRAAAELDLDLARRSSVGDRWHDLAGRAAVGARGVLVRTGYGADRRGRAEPGVQPSPIADNLMEAVSWILRRQ